LAHIQINVPAPEFRQDDLNGNPVSLSDYSGRMNLLLVFNRGFV